MLQPVAPTAAALAAATSDALLVGAAGPEDLPAAVRDAVVAMRQAHGYYRGGPQGREGDLQVCVGGGKRGVCGWAGIGGWTQLHATHGCAARACNGGPCGQAGHGAASHGSPSEPDRPRIHGRSH